LSFKYVNWNFAICDTIGNCLLSLCSINKICYILYFRSYFFITTIGVYMDERTASWLRLLVLHERVAGRDVVVG